MQVPEDFAGRLRLALKVVNLSAGALGAAVGVDKSVVSRWLAGRVAPTQHNLSRIAAVIARHRPGFSVLTFEAGTDEFRAALGMTQATPTAIPHGLPIPFGLTDAARKETARRGIEYYGLYAMYYWAFSAPGKVARMSLMLRPRDGLIEACYGADGFEFRGWALLLLNRLYVILAEERFEAMAFIVTNAGQQPRATFITGVLSGPAEGLLVPTAAPVVLVRAGEVTGDGAVDETTWQESRNFSPVTDAALVPAVVLAALHRASRSVDPLLRVPFEAGDVV